MLPSSKIQKLVYDEQKQLIKRQIDNWLLGFNMGKLETKDCDGNVICYEDVKFEGSPRDVFLSNYIEPFLEKATDRLIDAVANIFKNNKVGFQSSLSELRSEVLKFYDCVYSRMAYVERNLRANGNPSTLDFYDFTLSKQRMASYLIDAVIIAESSFLGSADQSLVLHPWSIKAEKALDESLTDFNERLNVIKGTYIGAGQFGGRRQLTEINKAVKSSFDAACESIGIVFSEAWATQKFSPQSLAEEQERILGHFYVRIKSMLEGSYAKAYLNREITPPWHEAFSHSKGKIKKTIVKSLSSTSLPPTNSSFTQQFLRALKERTFKVALDYLCAFVCSSVASLLRKCGFIP